METVTEYVRICPTCRAENAPEVMRCACGAMLAGIDVVRRDALTTVGATTVGPTTVEPTTLGPTIAVPSTAQSPTAESTTAATTAAGAAPSSGESLVCHYSDCGQASPPGSTICAYCNRALDGPAQNLVPKSLLNLPAILAARFRFVRSLPAKGSEAELLIVEPHAGGPEQIAKIYRQGIAPRADVQARIAQIDPRRRVQILESGFADGHAYELMEYCVHGSLRDRMQSGPLAGAELHSMIQQLAAAIASVHAAGLVHRDLKPENVLVRSLDPLELVLTDFSIASVLEGTQRFTGVARTLPYAAPESLSGVIDGKSDYWALGMIVLEAVSGTHPFAGLSEAVILHQLTTRNVDVTAVVDRNVRKLLRGLLLREPQTRWGESALTRWLAGDPTLPEPFELGTAAGFSEPYRLGEVVCTTPEQLAVALATHWREGIADLGNSQLVQWFRGVQKDHNVVRLLIELRHERQLHVDVQLLKLILYLAPGIPPVWRGESIALPAILAHASQALEGDVEASHWLHALYQNRVLETYAEAGNLQMKDVLERWNVAGDRFDKAWKDGLALIKSRQPPRGTDEAVNWDAAMFGHLDPTPPSIVGLHARLLAMAYDANWAERLRQRLLAEFAALVVHCPWLKELGDPLQMNAASLLVLEALLPEAKQMAAKQIKADIRHREGAAEEARSLRRDLDQIVTGLRATTQRTLPTDDFCDVLLADLGRYFGLVATVRGSGRSDEGWVELRNAAVRMEPVARRMQRLGERLRERLAVSGGWLNARTVVPLFLLLFLVPRLGARIIVPLIILVPLGIIGWQLVPNFMMLREIRDLAEKL